MSNKVKKTKVKKVKKKVVKTGKKPVKPGSLAGYRKKILNPKTNRYVFLDTKKGKVIETKLNKLLKKKKLTKGEQDYVDTILYSKYCKCTKSIIISESKKECPNRQIPYAVCARNVYLRKGLKPPTNASRLCRSTFKWYT